MTPADSADGSTVTIDEEPVNLRTAAPALLDVARAAAAGRAGRTLIPGAGAILKQTLLALASGTSLADHESPPAATLQVLVGRVRLTSGEGNLELDAGELAAIPPVRHGLDALTDAVVLLSVAQPGTSAGTAGASTG